MPYLLLIPAFKQFSLLGGQNHELILSQCTIYLASSPKGNAAYMAINEAQELVKQTGNLGVPLPLRNAPTKLMKQLGYGKGYQYSHDFPGNFKAQEFLPEELSNNQFFQSRKQLKRARSKKIKSMHSGVINTRSNAREVCLLLFNISIITAPTENSGT